jgi:hypothetical protein
MPLSGYHNRPFHKLQTLACNPSKTNTALLVLCFHILCKLHYIYALVPKQMVFATTLLLMSTYGSG